MNYTLLAYILFSAVDLDVPRSDCASSLSAIRLYAHTCACPSKAQMYFGSMNYATRIYTYSLIKPAFPFDRLTFSRKVLIVTRPVIGGYQLSVQSEII